VREQAPAFLFRAGVSFFANPKQPKSRPLKSITYELQICKSFVLTFMQNGGGVGGQRPFDNPPSLAQF
jgi:hypothetical protein